jgi:hypothetical protein
MPYANDQKEVTAVFFEIGKGAKETPIYQRAGFNFVSYDGDPDRYIEPVNANVQMNTLGTDHVLYTAPETRERLVGFEFFRGRPFEVHAFSPENVQF